MRRAWPLLLLVVGRTHAPGPLGRPGAWPGLVLPGRQGADPRRRRWELWLWLVRGLGLPWVWGGVWVWDRAWLITRGTGCGWVAGADSAVWGPEVNDPADGEIGEHLGVGAGKTGC